jgi:hypothetical protein
VRRLVAARRPILKWPPALQRLPAVCKKQTNTNKDTAPLAKYTKKKKKKQSKAKQNMH